MELLDLADLTGQGVLITGGTGGLGLAIASLLGRSGCRVFVGGRDPDHLNHALERLSGEGSEVSGATSDLATVDGVKSLFRSADDWLGGLDIAILNAGLGSHGKLVDMDHEECREVLNVNLLSAVHGTIEALQRMRGRRGQIVLIGSLSAEVFDADAAVYTATKAGIRGFAGSLRKEANPQGVRVSLIEPGSMATGMVDETEDEQKRMQRACMMLSVEDVARTTVFVLRQPERCDLIQVQVRPHLQLV